MDVADYIEERDDLVKHYGEYHRRVRDVLRYYDLGVLPKLPAGFEAVVPPSARTVPEQLAGALHPRKFRIDVPPRVTEPHSGYKSAEEIAVRLGKFHYDNLHRLAFGSGYSLMLELLKTAILFGMYPLKGPTFNPDLWEDKPESRGYSNERYDVLLAQWQNQRKRTLPIEAFCLNPLNVLPDPIVFNGKEPEYVYESYKRLAREVYQYGFAKDKKPFDQVEWIERWDKHSRIYIVTEGETKEGLIHKEHNPYGFIPYHFGFCGLGINSPTGKPEDKAVGVMWPILSGFSAEIMLMSMGSVVAQVYGVPAFRKIQDFEETPDLTPGAINPQAVQLEELFKRDPQIGRQILDMLQLIYQQREEATYSRTLAAERLSGVSTGIQQQLLTLQAYKRYEALLLTLKYTWGKVGGQIASIVENIIDEQLNEYIKPNEIQGYYACEVEFDIVDALERAAKIEEMMALAPVYSEKTRRAFYNFIPEAEDEEEQMMAELVAKHPVTIDAIAQKVAERLVGVQALEQAEQTGQKPRRFTPPAGGGGGLR